MRPTRPLLAVLALALVAASRAGAAGSGYELVQRGGTTISATSLAFAGPRALVETSAGIQTIDASTVDYYESFRRNLGHGGGNVVVYKTGALMRFESLEVSDGMVTVHVAGGSTFTVPESLIDFEASVREGAMVRVSGSAASGVVAVSTSGGGDVASAGSSYDEGSSPDDVQQPDEDPPDDTPPPTSSSAVRPTRPGRQGFTPGRRFGAQRSAVGAVDDGSGSGDESGDDVPVGDNPVPPPVSSFPPPRDSQQPPDRVGTPDSGQSVLVVSTTYSGEISGLQATVTFPPNLKVVEPVSFSGFGSALAMPTVNTRIPGQVQIIGVNNPAEGVAAGGEFLRLTFTWSGHAPLPQQFSVLTKATDTQTGSEVPTFPVEISLF
jgi:hypothetical protein